MATGQSIEERLQLIREIFLVIGENDRVKSHLGPQQDTFWLIRGILKDEPALVSNSQMLIRVLKKSPVWQKVLLFLKNRNSSCGRKGCGGVQSSHENGTGKCGAQHYNNGYSELPVQCTCPEYIPKPL